MDRYCKRKWFVLGLICAACLPACSPIDSTRPFDQAQAAVLIRSMYGEKAMRFTKKVPLQKNIKNPGQGE